MINAFDKERAPDRKFERKMQIRFVSWGRACNLESLNLLGDL
jgi:hypothetical protein